MIRRLSHAGVPVLSQDSAKEFYTGKLGFEVRTDAQMDGWRWLTVGPPDQPDLEFILYEPGPPMHDEESGRQIRELVAKGVLGAGVWATTTAGRPTRSSRAGGSTSCRSRPSARTGSRRCFATTPATGSA